MFNVNAGLAAILWAVTIYISSYLSFFFFCSEEDEIELQKSMSDPSLSCERKKAWIGVTDYQGEGNFLNVSRNTYEDVFVYEKDVGVELTETKWREFEPSGGVIENCVSSTFKITTDGQRQRMSCDNFLVACKHTTHHFFSLQAPCIHTCI